jgi:hypothetical protein
MKKNLFWMLAMLVCGAGVFTACSTSDDSGTPDSPKETIVAIDKNNFPDDNFREFLLSQSYGKDGKLTESDIKIVKSLLLFKMGIKNLKGIEYFVALETLRCDNNELTTLDVSKNTALTLLVCSDNGMTTLNVSKNTALTNLSCSGNNLSTLDLSGNTALTNLNCENNRLTTLDLTANAALKELYCFNNKLTTLNVSKKTALTMLYCYNNQLTTLDLSGSTALYYLYCSDNKLTTLDFTDNKALEMVICDHNQLTSIVIPENSKIALIDCHLNNISGANMDNLINSLPRYEVSNIAEAHPITIYRNDEGKEGNVCTKTQVAAAKAKGWLPLYWNSNNQTWEDYVGSDE